MVLVDLVTASLIKALLTSSASSSRSGLLPMISVEPLALPVFAEV
jgi:hypothetical protein